MAENTLVNSVGMRFARIEAGTFYMGNDRPLPDALVRLPHRRCGQFDERPAHHVSISKPFHLGVCQVTNAQYERFDPSHRVLRGKLGFSKLDDEAVVFVSWHDAVAFCEWLSAKERENCRLPTEAEWEYACRAGTTSPYHTGDDLPEEYCLNPGVTSYPAPGRSRGDEDIVPLVTGCTPANAWGLHGMHGNVEEWCSDWYGPYDVQGPYADYQSVDPVGYPDGDFRVARGGSHSTEPYYLRSSSRAGTLPDERNWLIGFRVAVGEHSETPPVMGRVMELHERNVRSDAPPNIETGPDHAESFFSGPRPFVTIPGGSEGPLFSRHNHVPDIAACSNGDLLAIWYTCVEESGREVSCAASRLRWGTKEWEPASLFWDAPSRNDVACALWTDEAGTMFHFSGLSFAATYGCPAIVMRTSTDSGATWSKARFILREHRVRQSLNPAVFRMSDGTIVLPCDAGTKQDGGCALWLSSDDGESWHDAGGTIRGIHAGVVERADGSLLAFGRGNDMDGMMPTSVSGDSGKTWEYSASCFQPIHRCQRLVLMRLREGPIMFVSFANKPLTITDISGAERQIEGMYSAVSCDDGETWTNYRPVSDDGPERRIESFDGFAALFGISRSEPVGYLAACQARNGLIHLVSSRNHYTFNYTWLVTPPPALD